MKQISEQIASKIEEIFDEEELNRIARETGFIQRSTSKLEGADFVKLISMGFSENAEQSLEGLCDILQQINPEAEMSPQALSQRINSEEAVKYLEKVLKEAIQKNIKGISDDKCSELLAYFKRVFLEDSTQCSLNEKLAEAFKGSGGSASKSSVKIDLIFELKKHIIEEISLNKGVVPDQSLAGTILNHIQPNDLVIRDLGFFKIDILEKIDKKDAFYLSRLPKSVNVYQSDSKNASPVNLPSWLDKKFPSHAEIDVEIYIGNNKMPCRLIAYKLPEEIINLRRRKAGEAAKKKGRTVSQDSLKWLDFGFFITNVPRNIWPADVVGTIYRMRWQIELIFKTWKSLLNIHILKGTRPERIKCLIYGRLIVITVMTMIYGYVFQYAKNTADREISAFKLFAWLKRNGRLLKAVHKKSAKKLLNDLVKNISKVCKQKRARKTSLQLVEEKIKYLESFSPSEIKKMKNNNNIFEILDKIEECFSICFTLLEVVFRGIVSCLEILHKNRLA